MVEFNKSLYFLFLLLIFSNSVLISQTQVCVEVLESSEDTMISCPDNSLIESVDFDSYGLPTGSCGNYQINSCDCSPNTVNWIGTNSQIVYANDSLCGDPCEDSFKRRYVQISCSLEGCTDDNAINWDSDATIDDGSCEFAPIINISPQYMDEDQVLILNLSDYSSDVDGDQLSYSANVTSLSGGNFVAVAEIQGTTLTITPIQHYFGIIYVNVSVNDGNYYDSSTMIITVTNVNDPPEIQEGPYLNATIDQPYTYVLRGEDVDNTQFIFSLFDNPVGMFIEDDFGFEARIVFTPTSVQYTPGQTFQFSVSVSDGEYVDSETYVISVQPSSNNIPPVVTFEDNYQLDEDETSVIVFLINDVDDNITTSNISIVLDYENHSGYNPFQYPSFGGGENTNFNFTLEPFNDWNGQITLIVDVDDGESWSSQSIDINVLPINDPPDIQYISDITVPEGNGKTVTKFIYDIDTKNTLNDNLDDYSEMSCEIENLSTEKSIIVEFLSSGEAIYNNENNYYETFHYSTLDQDWFGTEEFQYTCEDVNGGSNVRFYDVSFQNINDAPVMNEYENNVISIDEDNPVTITVTGYDIDNTNLVFSAQDYSNISLDINQTQNFSDGQASTDIIITPNTNYNGQDNMLIYLFDQSLLSEPIDISIDINAINDAPICTSFNINIEEGNTSEIELNGSESTLICNENLSDNDSVLCNCLHESLQGACDIENDVLSYQYTNPENGTISLNGSLITYTPDEDFFGEDSFTYTAFDGELTSTAATVTIMVTNINDTPTTESQQTVETNEDETVSILLTGNDIDSENLIFSISQLPSNGNVVFFRETSEVIYTPNLNYNGSDTFMFSVSDGSLSSQGSVIVNINPVNDTPVTTSFSLDTDEDNPVSYDIDNTLNNLVCNDNLADNNSILCDCESSALQGGCDIEEESLTCFVEQSTATGLTQIIFSDESASSFNVQYASSNGTYNNGCDLPQNSIWLDGDEVWYNVTNPIGGFQFEVEGTTATGASGGDAGSTGFTIVVTDNLVMAFSFTGSTISTGCGVLTELNLSGDSIGTVEINGTSITYTPLENHNGNDNFAYYCCDDSDESLCSNISQVSVNISAVNDSPVLEEIEDQVILEDNSFLYSINASDIDSTPTYELAEDGNAYFESSLTENNEILITPIPNYHGTIANILVRVSDEEFTLEETFNLTIEAVNDIPLASDISIQLIEDCDDTTTDLNSLSSNISYCNENLSDNGSILCDCNILDTQPEQGSCDYDNTDLACHISTPPSNGSITVDGSVATYIPNDDYYGDDTASYYCCDNENPSLCSDVYSLSYTISDANDQPIMNNCNDLDEDNICDENVLTLEDINSGQNILYEDCNSEHADTNLACDDFLGVTVEQIRTGYNDFSSSDSCSSLNTWYDNDCEIQSEENNSNPEILFGIAVDTRMDNVNMGNWEYNLNNDNLGFREFTFIDTQNDECNYILLDDQDKIRFVPNSNVYSINDEISTYPSIVFYAWDQSQGNSSGLCLNFSTDEQNQDCNNSIPISETAIRAFWKINSINDPFNIVMNNFSNSFEFSENNILSTYNNVTGNSLSDNLITIYEDEIKFSDEKVLSLLLFNSLNNDNSLFFIEDIDSTPEFEINNNNENLINVSMENSEQVKVNFNTLDNMNGETTIDLNIIDGDFTESVSLNVKVLQVNDPINLSNLYIEDGLSNYYNASENIHLNNQSMFTSVNNNNYIKLPDYLPENFPTPDEYLEEHTSSLFTHQFENPESPDIIYFKWSNNQSPSYLQDIDTNPIFNSEDNLYTVFYRLELLDIINNNVYVLKDSISYNDFDFDLNDEQAKTSVNFMNYFKNYTIDNESDCIDNIEFNIPSLLDISGFNLYKWRITAQNYLVNDSDIESENEIACTSWSTSDQFYIDMEYPDITYDFILNEIYTEYFDLYLIPTEPLHFYPGQNMYMHYGTFGSWIGETISINKLNIENEEIYFSSDNFDDYGAVGLTSVLYDIAGNINIEHKHVTFNIIIPGEFYQFYSPNNIASIEINGIDKETTILINEVFKKQNEHINSLTDIVIVNTSSNIDYLLKFDKSKINFDFENIENLKIYSIENDLYLLLDTFHNEDYLYTSLKKPGVFGVLYLEDSIENQIIPENINILSCYPNPFNPNLVIEYFLEESAMVNVDIYNIMGQKITTLENSFKEIGTHYINWSAEEGLNNKTPSGIYIIKMKYNDNLIHRKVTLVK